MKSRYREDVNAPASAENAVFRTFAEIHAITQGEVVRQYEEDLEQDGKMAVVRTGNRGSLSFCILHTKNEPDAGHAERADVTDVLSAGFHVCASIGLKYDGDQY
jgi:hypothetical protein